MSAYILSNCLEHQLIDDHYTRADWLAEGQPNLRVANKFPNWKNTKGLKVWIDWGTTQQNVSSIGMVIILQLLQSGLHYQAGLLNGQRACHLVVSFQCSGALTWQFEEASLLTSLKLMSVGGSKNLFFPTNSFLLSWTLNNTTMSLNSPFQKIQNCRILKTKL